MKGGFVIRWLLTGSILGAASAATILLLPGLASAQGAAKNALTGLVTSQQEGAMEGVVVSAKRAGSTITISVVSDGQGRYSFPMNRMARGKYSITMRAVGYQLRPMSVTLGGQPRQANLRLTKVSGRDLETQLSSGEWLMSVPGTDQQHELLSHCTECHSLQRPLFSNFNAADATLIVQRMTVHPPNSSPVYPQFYDDANEYLSHPPTPAEKATGEYLSTVNLSAGPTRSYPLKTLPRPKGEDTKVIYTSYELPDENAHVHDEVLDGQGNIWFDSFDSNFIGLLNLKTGKAVTYPVPVIRPNSPKGELFLAIDSQGRIVTGGMEQDGIARFDPKTKSWDSLVPPIADSDFRESHLTFVEIAHMNVDGNAWVNFVGTGAANGTWQLHLDTNKWTKIPYPAGSPAALPYQMVSDSHNNMVGHGMLNTNVWTTDAKTLQTNWYPMPDGQRGCRRGHMTDQNIEWCGDFYGNGLMTFDMNTHKILHYWKMPTPWSRPYDVEFDNKKYAWTGGMDNDLILRFDPVAGKVNQYLLPVLDTNIRSVEVQFSDSGPSSLWIADQHANTIIHVEPLSP